MTDFWQKDAVATGPNFWDKDQKAGESEKKPEVGYVEDMTKGGISGLAQGALAIPGTVGDLQSIAKAGAEKLGDKTGHPLGWLADKFDTTSLGKFLKDESAKTLQASPGLAHTGDMMTGGAEFPTTSDIQKKVEETTGPFYQAQTGPGKAVQTATQVAPSIALGGGSLPATIAKSAGAGVASEGAGEAASALKGYLPDFMQPYAEPVARAVGAAGGTFAPAGVRRAVTPLPMTDERLATVNALRGTNPELVNASTAGQLTESPRVMGLEGRAPSMADVGQRQAEGYTQGVMRQAGADGHMFDTPGLQAAKARGGELDALQNANRMSPSEFQLLNRGVGQDRAALYREVGRSQPFEQVRDAIRLGPSGGIPNMPLDMTGERYGALKQIIQNAGSSAPTTHEQMAIYNARRRMNEAFHNSMPSDQADQLRNLDQGYANYKTIENIPREPGGNTLTPKQVHSKAPVGSELERHADQAAEVMTPLPKPGEGGPGTKLAGGLLGGAVGAVPALFGHTEAALVGTPFASYYGANHLRDVTESLKNAAGRAAATDTGQAYLGNQLWRPGPHTTSADAATIARMLMSPPIRNSLPEQSR